MFGLRNPNSISEVLRFPYGYWKREWKIAVRVAISMVIATLADLFLPVYSGRLVDAITLRGISHEQAFHNALIAIATMAILGAVLIAARYAAFIGISRLTVRIMTRMASDAFWRVQRLSTDWHANHFAGSIVRRITRGMWAVDLMDDTLLLGLLPAVVILIGSSLVLGAHWPGMGLLAAAAAIVFTTVSIALVVGYVAPAARLSNAQDTRVGGVLADSITCNGVSRRSGRKPARTLSSRAFSGNGAHAHTALGASHRSAVVSSFPCCWACAHRWPLP
jgi:ATP-binding cassette subfamily B protein